MKAKEAAYVPVLLMVVAVLIGATPTTTTTTTLSKRWWILDYYRAFTNTPALSLPPHCLPEVEARIVGGHIVQRNSWPWVVAIRALWGPVRCGGVLVTTRHALTAAHCLPTPLLSPWVMRVVIGGHTHQDGTEVGITVISVHPHFGKMAEYDSDIAVLTLTADVEPNHGVRPICVASGTPPVGSEGVVLGWGMTGYGALLSGALRQATVSVLPRDACFRYGAEFTGTMLCAGGSGTDACLGDSGGPLVVSVGGVWVVVGVVTYGRGCGNGDFPGVYTNVVPLRKWIESVLF